MLSLWHQRAVSSRTVKEKTILICGVLIHSTGSTEVAVIHTFDIQRNKYFFQKSVTFSKFTKILLTKLFCNI